MTEGVISRPNLARATRLMLDIAALSLAFWLAWMIRFDWDLPFDMIKRAFFAWPWVVGLQFVILSMLDVPRFSWRHVSVPEARRIFLGVALAAVVLAVARWVSVLSVTWFGWARYALVPLGVILADFALAFLTIVGVRVLRRLQHESRESKARLVRSGGKRVPTMLVGAGSAGHLVTKEIHHWPNLGIEPIGFLDDDPGKHGLLVNGLPVVGSTERLTELCRQHGARQVLITIANAPGSTIRRIKALCEAAGLPAKIIPGIYEIVGGQVNLSSIRDVAIEDLLGREPVVLDEEAIAAGVVRDRVVLVTGAGGSIGSELCRQIARFSPRALILAERAENNLFEIHRELRAQGGGASLVPCLVDARDVERMRALFVEHQPTVVFHAAAHKHVPMVEWNAAEALENNVLGTRVVADLAHEQGAEAFVMVSTDKAVNPTSVMGATKRLAEIYVQALSQRSSTRFVTVRFGNVLGSAGSVVPIFKQQIAAGGPVTVTHPDMTRYFMTIPEAAQLILQAASMGEGGEIFVLDMGEPVKIVDLARDLIRLSGLRPDEDVEIEFTGVRPGEKLFEELSTTDEHADRTKHPKIFVGKLRPYAWEDVLRHLEAARAACYGDGAAVRRVLKDAIPEFSGADFTAGAGEPASSEPASNGNVSVGERGREGGGDEGHGAQGAAETPPRTKPVFPLRPASRPIG